MTKNHRSLLHQRCHEVLHRRRVHSIPCLQPVTTIRYGLPQAGRVSLKIYNLLGGEVVTLMDEEQKAAGYHVAIWEGRDRNGVYLSSGVYMYRMRAGSVVMTQKMALVK